MRRTSRNLSWAIMFSDATAAAHPRLLLSPAQAGDHLPGMFPTALPLAECWSRSGQLFPLLPDWIALERGLLDPVRGEAIWIRSRETSARVAAAIVLAEAFGLILWRHQGDAGRGPEYSREIL